MGWKMIKERQKMDQMNKMKEWIRRKGMEKQPRYYLRKRTIGIVSCVVGCSFFMASTGIYAQTMEGNGCFNDSLRSGTWFGDTL